MATVLLCSGRSTVEQLREDIDQGRTGDKVQALDPAAVPLGADEEAAGTPMAPETIAVAHAHESRREGHRAHTEGIGHAWWVFGAAAAIGLVVSAGALVG